VTNKDAAIAPQIVNGWRELWLQLVDRTKRPFSHVVFVLYFFIGVVAFGALGVWFEIVRWINEPESGPAAVLTALETFFPALVGSTSLQVIFEENSNKRMRAFAVSYLVVFVALVIILMFVSRIPTEVAFGLAVLSAVGALWVWWIANANNAAFQDDVNDEDPLGGSVKHKPAGSLTGFQA
jgi:hypothetical protein